jgi:hypothetical protein
MKNLLRIFNPFNIVTVCRAIGDARAEQAAYELLQQEDALMAQRLTQHRLANRQRKVAKELKLVMATLLEAVELLQLGCEYPSPLPPEFVAKVERLLEKLK